MKFDFSGSHNEWDPLEEVILGTTTNAQIPQLKRDQLAIEYPELIGKEVMPNKVFPQHILEETEEDLLALSKLLTSLGIKVRRPEDINFKEKIKTPDWETDGFYNYCPRDSMLVVGDKIIEAPMTLRSRLFDQYAYKKLLVEYLNEGANWLSAPKPRLLDETYSFENKDKALNNLEPIFDAANILRAGRDLFYLISNTGNELGAKWLQRILGNEYKVHVCRDVYNGIHIDSTISLLRPGLVLLNPERVNMSNIPEPLKSWDKIWCPEMLDNNVYDTPPLSSKWIGMNLLMLSPKLALVDKKQIPLIKELKKNGIEALDFNLRNSRILGGGFHCVTLDTKRKGSLENYF